MAKPFVAILMGSDSDLPSMEPSFDVLKSFGIAFEAAGMAAHLAGAVAAATLKPVIGVPINASLDGLDALLSTVQMPGGIPVATVAIGKAGAKNAAYLAAQILATADTELAQQLRDEREKNAQAVIAKDAALQERLQS